MRSITLISRRHFNSQPDVAPRYLSIHQGVDPLALVDVENIPSISMAPLPTGPFIRDRTLSSLELDSRSSSIDLPAYLGALSLSELKFLSALPSPPASNTHSKRSDIDHAVSNPLSARSDLNPRTPAKQPSFGAGSVPPDAINMKGIQALIALIGASFVLGGIWFFFWAKNGGFQWRKGDWEDYKSTVLRRKGPDGKTLSNATKSTRLGGGSVVASGYSDEGMTELSSEAPIIVEGKGKKVTAKKGLRGGGHGSERKKAQKIRQQKEERWEGGFDDDVRAYRHEKPARVGGLNRDSDAQFYGTDYSYSETEPSSFGGGGGAGGGEGDNHGQHRQSSRSRQSSPDKHLQQHHHHHHHHHASISQPEQQQKQSRRDFSYGLDSGFTATASTAAPSIIAPSTVAPSTHIHTTTTATRLSSRPSSRYQSPSKPAKSRSAARHSVPGSYVEPLDFEAESQGTKSYHHPLPGLSGGGAGGGFRAGGRGRRDSLDDSD